MGTTKKCAGCGQETESSLKCPKCLQLQLPSSYFCSQDCFKKNWSLHSAVHKAPATPTSTALVTTSGYDSLEKGWKVDDFATWVSDIRLRPFIQQTYRFTGKLRPYPTPLPRSVPAEIPRPDYALSGESRAEERDRSNPIVVYAGAELEAMRESCRIGREALDLAHKMCKPGVTGDDIDKAVHEYIVGRGGYPSPLNYYGFQKACCVSINETICHGVPDLRPLEEGDIVNVDVTVYYKGMHGDLNETFCVGKCKAEDVKLVKAAHDAMHEAIKICRPGEMYRRIGLVIQDHVEALGFSVVRRYTGHGIGRLFHTNPTIPHYRGNKAKGIMKVGHVFTIEPMVNAGKHFDDLWADQWTAVTRDGLNSAQFEHQIVITEDGCEILTARLPESPALDF